MAEPIRTCIGCRKKATKWELVRIVRNESGLPTAPAGQAGRVSVDESRKNPGRGAYVCLNPQCIELALVPKKLNKVLRANLEPKEIESLKQVLINLLQSLESPEEGGKRKAKVGRKEKKLTSEFPIPNSDEGR